MCWAGLGIVAAGLTGHGICSEAHAASRPPSKQPANAPHPARWCPLSHASPPLPFSPAPCHSVCLACFLAFLPPAGAFENVVQALYKYAVPKPKAECSKGEQLGVSFAAGYIAGIFCAVVSHPADNLVSKMNSMKGVPASE